MARPKVSGRPDKFLPYGRQSINDADIQAVSTVLRSDWLTTGPDVEAFETEFASRVGTSHAASCANGTAALHLAALALGLGPGDHVIVPSITFLATANAVRFVGAEVIFADVDPGTGLMMPEHTGKALADAGDRAVKAVFPVHLNGQTGDPAALKDLADQNGLRVVEDACHALGTTYLSGNECYAAGACEHCDLATFSFHPVKTIATGEGGMVTGKSVELIERVKRLRNHGMSRDPASFTNTDLAFDKGDHNPWYYEMAEIGFNYRLTDMQCALGLSQLQRLEAFLEKRRALVAQYRAEITDLAPEIRPVTEVEDCVPGWHLFVVHIDFDALKLRRAQVMHTLQEQGIGSQVHYIPLHHQPYYRRRYGDLTLPGAEAYYERCLSLPLFPDMTEADVTWVVAALRSAIGR